MRGAEQPASAARRDRDADDETLARQLASGLDEAFEDLVRAYQDRLFAFGLRLTGSRRDAEEIAQDAFVRAYRALARYPSDRVAALKIRPWLFQITVNVARNRARTRRASEVALVSTDGSRDPIAVTPDDSVEQPDTVAERRDEQARLAAVVAGLPERYRTALVLRHIQDLSYQEIAVILGQPVGTVKSNVHRGVALLRAALAKAGNDEAGDEANTAAGEPAGLADLRVGGAR